MTGTWAAMARRDHGRATAGGVPGSGLMSRPG
jgi:hypothetical protein